MPFKISTALKRRVFETNEWVKDGHTISETTTWRWGWVEVETKPDLSSYDPDEGIDVYATFNVLDQEQEDVVEEDREFSDTMSDDEREEVEAFLEENSIFELEELGWDQGDSKTIFKGPLEVEEI